VIETHDTAGRAGRTSRLDRASTRALTVRRSTWAAVLAALVAALLGQTCANRPPVNQVGAAGNVASHEAAAVDRLLTLVVERLALAPDVARAKWNSKAPIEDRVREDQIIAAVGAGAGRYAVPRATAERFFRAQIDASKLIQRAMVDEFTAANRPPFDTVRDLAADIRPALDRLTDQMMTALGAALPVLERPGGRQVLEARLVTLGASAPGGPTALRTALAPLVVLSR
jgi:chorismate mutase